MRISVRQATAPDLSSIVLVLGELAGAGWAGHRWRRHTADALGYERCAVGFRMML